MSGAAQKPMPEPPRLLSGVERATLMTIERAGKADGLLCTEDTRRRYETLAAFGLLVEFGGGYYRITAAGAAAIAQAGAGS